MKLETQIVDSLELAMDLVVGFVRAMNMLLGYLLLLVWSLAIVAMPTTAHAGGYCYNSGYHQSYVQHEVVHEYPQTIIEHQNQFYSVGADVRQYATAPQAVAQAQMGELERQMARLQDRYVDLKQSVAVQPQQAQMVYCVPMQAQAAYCPPGTVPAAVPQQQPAPQQPPQSAPSAPRFSARASIVQQACVKCHSGPAAKGDLDLTQPLTCEQKQKAIAKVALGEMPKATPDNPNPKFSPEQFVQFTKEISALKTAGTSGTAGSSSGDAED